MAIPLTASHSNKDKQWYVILKVIGRKGLWWLFFSSIAGVFMSAVELALAYLLQLLLVRLGISQTAMKLPFGIKAELNITVLMVCLLIVGVLRGVLSFLIVQTASVVNEVIMSRLKLILFYESLFLKDGYLSASRMLTQLSEIFPKASAFCYYGSLLIPNIVTGILLMVMMASITWKLTLIGLCGVLLIGLIVLRINKFVRRASAHLPEEQEQLMGRVHRVIRNYFFLRSVRMLEKEGNELARHTLSYSTHTIQSNFYANLGGVTPPLLGICFIVVLIYVHLHSSWITGMQFMSFIYLFLRFVQTLGSLSSYFGVSMGVYTHFKMAGEYFMSFTPETIYAATTQVNMLSGSGSNINSIHSEFQQRLQKSASNSPAPAEAPEVCVENLSFTYPEATHAVLDAVSFKVPKGTQFGIVGQSGKGKSTLLGLLMGLLKPNSGSISMNDSSPEKFFEKNPFVMSYVGPESFLITGTIRENLLYGLPNTPDDTTLQKAVEFAHLADFIASQPKGLEHIISEKGDGLSTGQKQRLSLARAFLLQPRLLILDEISANLDEKTEADLAESLNQLKGSVTTIIVSHRKGILKYVDATLQL